MYHHIAYVADINDQFILGLDFLKENNFKMDFKNNELHSCSEDISVFKTKNSDIKPVHHITTKSETTSPPRTETIVSEALTEDNNFHYGLIEYPSTDNSNRGVLVAFSLVDLSRNVVPSAELDDKQRSSAGKLLIEFEELFSRKLDDVGRTKMTQHRIDTGNHLPIKQHPRRLPFAKQEEVANLLMEMHQNDIIEP
ncbi:retrovirus-related Pol polyprotein from transposon 412 [Nephila pilipes]|uniref:Retrovirus-related Pol polyprotein from transposon 412 n=1 Tax=Nephila pilipes TaxID=299642 RepID=A0A8X6IBE3_NEPPI|nr:retrovirus-related Pol polyprotein from transposon 412 [Nephila pilipes]